MRQIKPVNNHGSINIRFTYQGHRYLLSGLGSFTNPVALTRATVIASNIYLDCLTGKFDGDAQSYLGERVAVTERKKTLKFLEIWDLWVEFLDLEEHTKDNHYRCVRNFLVAAERKTVADEFLKLRDTLAASTWNKRRCLLKSCTAWGINEGLLELPNPFERMRASTKKSEYKVNPFSKTEVKAIIAEIESKHLHYLPFITFLFSTGCRTGEAVGFKWDYVNFTNRTITICETLSRSAGSNTRVQKEGKTGSVVTLPMNDDLYQMLNSVWLNRPENNKANLVFTSPTGKFINPDNFRNRIWKPVLEKLGLEYRVLYQTRHTLLSHVASEHGLLAAAAVAGHKDATMVTRHYAKFTGKIELPGMF